MRRKEYLLVVAVVMLALAGSGACAQTTMWLSTDAGGAAIPGDTINVAPGGSVQLYCFLNSPEVGNTFEIMVGYDRSDATTHGAGTDTNDGELKNLTLVSTEGAIEGTMPGSFTVLQSAVLDASGREETNTELGGRPYGFVGRAATLANAAPDQIQCFSFTLQNNMALTESQYVVLSNFAGGNSYSDAWKHGTTLYEDAYALNVVTAGELPIVGTTNKSVLDAIMAGAASDYVWVLWGEVTVIDGDNFSIDDGSGGIINVVATGHSVINGDYVSVRGTLNVGTAPPTLTSQEIKKHN